MDSYSEGSVWRRWDLHVHTPETNKNDQFEGRTPKEKWDKFYAAVEDYVGDGANPVKSVAVIGITDYLSAKNYFKVKKDNRFPSSVKMVLPNVELRITPISKKEPINIHCIFNPDLTQEELNEDFFSKLNFEYNQIQYKATTRSLINLGRAYKGDDLLDDHEAYIEGVNQFVISFDNLKAVFKDNPGLREQTIVVVSNGSNDGVSGLHAHQDYFVGSNSQLDATRQGIYQFSDLIFSANENDIIYFLGKGKDSKEEVIRKCGKLMGCIHGSDAHKLSDLFRPNNEKYCWIKANPTFEGFKQILYEPEQRIRILSTLPEEKADYQVISAIKVDDPGFQSEPILLNNNLTCIIGGKSTGKSLLLHNIAVTIDENQTLEKERTTGIVPEDHNDSRRLSNVKVIWKDQSVNNDGGIHKIVYIPQTYLNRISDKGDGKTEIDELISSILLQNAAFKNSYEKMNSLRSQAKQEIDGFILKLGISFERIQQLEEQKKSIGTKEGLEKRIEKLNEQKRQRVQEGTISDIELQKYDQALRNTANYEKEIHQIILDLEKISTIDSLFDIKSLVNEFSCNMYQRINDVAVQIKSKADKEWGIEKAKITQELNELLLKNRKNNEQEKDIISKIKPKVEQNEAINALTKALQDENNKLVSFNELQQSIDEEKKAFNSFVVQLTEVFLSLKGMHDAYADFINRSNNSVISGLEFNVNTVFRKDSFIEKIEGSFDKRSLKSSREIINIEDFSDTWLNKECVKDFILACLNGRIKIVKKNSPTNVLREVLADWFMSAYRIKMDNDFIDVMSPGKKALALLKLLIDLDENTCPILIDQPEDDLDNRSIFNELIPFLRKKKVQRQIIVVTHNANVVLGGDAEEIIVANQRGQNAENRKYRFEYKSGAIEDIICNPKAKDILSQKTIQEHICEILEGGKEAFELRRKKYHM